jgi:hypothetical protein
MVYYVTREVWDSTPSWAKEEPSRMLLQDSESKPEMKDVEIIDSGTPREMRKAASTAWSAARARNDSDIGPVALAWRAARDEEVRSNRDRW